MFTWKRFEVAKIEPMTFYSRATHADHHHSRVDALFKIIKDLTRQEWWHIWSYLIKVEILKCILINLTPFPELFRWCCPGCKKLDFYEVEINGSNKNFISWTDKKIQQLFFLLFSEFKNQFRVERNLKWTFFQISTG